jgi:hypothetical protein
MNGNCFRAGLLVCLLFTANGLAQVGINATLSGTVLDPTGALIPGVDVTATNTATGLFGSLWELRSRSVRTSRCR